MSAIVDWLRSLMGPTHSGEWINGATGALGAMLGSAVTLLWTAWYSHRTRRRERREKFAAGAFAAYVRLNQIYSVSTIIRNHLDQGHALAASKGQPICTTTMAVNRMSGPVIFPIEELWTLTQVGGVDLVNRVGSLDHAFNSLLDVMDRYDETRRRVWAKFPTPDHMDGIVGSVDLTQKQMQELAPDIEALDHILVQTIPMARKLVEDTFEALTLLVHARTKPLGRKFGVVLPNPAGQSDKLNAEDAKHARWWQRKSPS